jgi:pilus assembly protein CpaC
MNVRENRGDHLGAIRRRKRAGVLVRAGALTQATALRLRGVACLAVSAILLSAIGEVRAQRLVQLTGQSRTASISIAVGKTQDVRVDVPFSDVTVGDPEVADVAPLTDHSLSILGKRIGTTRITAYADGKQRQIGVFDVEVSYDISRLAEEIRAVSGRGIRVSSVNGRIMLSGSSPDGPTLDKAVMIARQFAPDIINTVQVAQPQQVMLEVRFIEASREAGRELGVQWNVFNKNVKANIGSRQTPALLPYPYPGSAKPQRVFSPERLLSASSSAASSPAARRSTF